jgi:hypothetical protein
MSTRDEETIVDVDDFVEVDKIDIQDDDCGFLIDRDGNLKTIFGPNDMFACPSDTMQQILSIFGINGPEEANSLNSRVLH